MAPEKIRTVPSATSKSGGKINLFGLGKIIALARSILVTLRSGRKAIQMFAVRKDNSKHGKEFIQIIATFSRRMETAE